SWPPEPSPSAAAPSSRSLPTAIPSTSRAASRTANPAAAPTSTPSPSRCRPPEGTSVPAGDGAGGDAVDEAGGEHAHPAADLAAGREQDHPLALRGGGQRELGAAFGGHDLRLLHRTRAKRLAVRAQRPAVDLGEHEVGADQGDRDAAAGKLDTQRVEEAVQGVLGGGVPGSRGHAGEAG